MELQDILNPKFTIDHHAKALKAMILGQPIKYTSLDNQRIYAVFFVLNSLDMLNKIDEMITAEDKQNIIQWIYCQQIIKRTKQTNILIGGFRGSPCSGFHTEYPNGEIIETLIEEDEIHQDIQTIVFTQCALSCLKILGDDLHLVSRPHIIATLKRLQSQETGSIRSCDDAKENDLRYLYSSLVVSALLKDFDIIDTELATQQFLSCFNAEEGGFGIQPGMESHGGATFCAVAGLKILDKLHLIPNKTKLVHWLVSRQQLLRENTASLDEHQVVQVEIISEGEYIEEMKLKEDQAKEQKEEETENQKQIPTQNSEKKNQTQVLQCVGFHGRVCKFPDSCYTTWIGASLEILGFSEFIASENVIRFIKLCESFLGGFKKYPFDASSDPVHTHFSIIGLNILGQIKNEEGTNYSLLLRNSRLK